MQMVQAAVGLVDDVRALEAALEILNPLVVEPAQAADGPHEAQAAGELRTEDDPAQVAFELDAYGMMVNVGFVLHDDPRTSTMPGQPSTLVFVEGASDRAAVLKLAERRGRDLRAEGVDVVAFGGAHALPRFLASVPNAKLVGLCDAREAREFTRALEHVYVCHSDLEDELIRAVGTDRLQEIIEAQGELHSFRTLQKQPAQRARTIEEQLRVFLGNRKIRYAELLVSALDLANVPR